MIGPRPAIPVAGRVLFATFGFVFAGVGLTVLGFLWFGDDGFGSPPLFFRIFGSLIAIAFLVFGGTMGLSALTVKAPEFVPVSPERPVQAMAPAPVTGGAFSCPHCGAALTSSTEASPHGDIKCSFCGAWFNIHRRSA